MKKIMFLCHGAGNGGAERVITTIASEFAKRDYIVSMVTTNEDHNDYEIDRKVVRHRVISNSSNPIFRTIDRIIKIRSYIKNFKPNCIISFSSIPNMQVILADMGIKNKLIISERTDPSKYPTSKAGRIFRTLLYPLADKIVFQTEEAKNYFSKRIQRKGTIIVNPIRDDLPLPIAGKREKTIIGVGSLGEQKNWAVALNACNLFFEKYSDYVLEIYGEGPLRSSLQEIIDNSPILRNRVELKGFSNDVVSKMTNAQMYVSSSDYEGISNSMLEALAVGTPVICTDCPVGGARMFIKNGENGFLFPVRDSNKMAECMMKIASDERIREKFSLNSMKIREQLQLASIINQWEKECE